MENIYDSLRGLISQDMISKASTLLDERTSNVSDAVSSIVASLLGVILKNGDTPQIRNILEEAGNLNILSRTDGIYEEKPTQEQQRIGDDFLQHLLGDKAADFTAPIADRSGVSTVGTNRLISMIAPVVCGFLGNKLVKDVWSMPHLLNEIKKDKAYFVKYIPSALVSSFGLSSILNGNVNPNTTTTERQPEKKKSNFGWLVWLLLILLLLLIFFWWRSCRDTNTTETYSETMVVEDTISQAVPDGTMVDSDERLSTVLTLPNGATMHAYKGGVEDEMIKFLQSDEYKNATADELKNKWFEFDNIDFEFGSATELKPESRAQLDNIIAILKNYKDAKIKIAAFADKKGTEKANMEISKKRAKTIESMLDKGGVGSQVVTTEGYGDEYAKHSASESDAQRSEDRDIAFRFVK